MNLSSAGSIQDSSHHSLQGVPYTGPTYTLDRTAPTAKVNFPASGGDYSTTAYNAGCTPVGICGTAADTTGVASVRVSILGPNGKYWNGSGFVSSAEAFNAASGTTTWSYPLSLPADGVYTVHVQATDTLGNAEAGTTDAASSSFTVDTTAPAAPTVTSGAPSYPPAASPSTSASFSFADSSHDTTSYRCELSPAVTYTACANPVTFSSLAQGKHTLLVEALDGAGNVSSPSAPYVFFVDTLSPAAPAFALTPPNPSTDASSTFKWTDSDPGGSTVPPTGSGIAYYLCSVENGGFIATVPSDGASAQPCTSPLTYNVATTNSGVHQFAVEAVDYAGNVSQVASYSWKVQKGSIANFTIAGNVTNPLYPGPGVQQLNLTLTNPNSAAITITGVTAAVSSVAALAGHTCATANFSTTNYTGAGFTLQPGTHTLSESGVLTGQLPTISMPNSGDQTGCEHAQIDLTYGGSAHS